MLGHVVPAGANQVLVAATLGLGETVLALGGPQFLGLGAELPTAECGSMLATGRESFAHAPWQLLGPGLALVLSVAAATLSATRPIGDGARTAPLVIEDLAVTYPNGHRALDGPPRPWGWRGQRPSRHR